MNKIEDLKTKILESGIDFTQRGWGVKLGKIINKIPQYSIKWIKQNMPEFYINCYKV